MKDCVRYAPMLGAREGELSREEQSALDAHLQACPGCRALAADLAALDGLVGESLMARANARDFAPFVDGVMARVGAPGAAPAAPAAKGATKDAPPAQGAPAVKDGQKEGPKGQKDSAKDGAKSPPPAKS